MDLVKLQFQLLLALNHANLVTNPATLKIKKKASLYYGVTGDVRGIQNEIMTKGPVEAEF